ADIAPALRGAVAVARGEGRFDRMISDFRTSDAIVDFINSADIADYAGRGVSTPDLSIRIKTGPMAVPAPDADKIGDYKAVVRGHVETFAKDYRAYFETNDALDDVKRTMLDPMPRLTLVPGLGMFGHGRTLKEARIASDVGEMWIEAVRGAEAVGHFHPLSKADLFPLEY
ncbi:MAG: bifunctional aldolase/short-chain dehydrogenase, partial [Mesorhizobium sp.]